MNREIIRKRRSEMKGNIDVQKQSTFIPLKYLCSKYLRVSEVEQERIYDIMRNVKPRSKRKKQKHKCIHLISYFFNILVSGG